MNPPKSPISLLQELTVMKHYPMPEYEIVAESMGFKCVGTVAAVASASAVGENKKRAKHLCAERLLAAIEQQVGVFSPDTSGEPQANVSSSVDGIYSQLVQSGCRAPFDNFVGKLNEFSSQNGQEYPTYKEMGIAKQNFVLQCRFLSHATYGYGTTKKQAKQMAAQEMFKRVTVSDLKCHGSPQRQPEQTEQTVQDDAFIEKIALLYKQLSVQSESTPIDNTAVKSEEKPVEYEEQLDADMTENELKEALRQRGIFYIVTELQKDPLVLVMKTSETGVHPSYTFLNTGKTFLETNLGLLRKAFNKIRVISK